MSHEMKRNIKDSVFTYLFRSPEYTHRLYLALHPEDTSVNEDDCEIITLENVLSSGAYNDLGFRVGDRLIILVEAQSTFSYNVVFRILLYLANTYHEYTLSRKMNIYGTKPLVLPKPELYVVYTGAQKETPDQIHFSDLTGEEYDGALQVNVRVLRYRGTDDIIDQYIRFCEIADEERKKHGRTQKTIDEIIHRCLEENILAAFLTQRKKEVTSMITTLFTQAEIEQMREWEVEQRIEQERQKGIYSSVRALRKALVDDERIVDIVSKEFAISPQEVQAVISRENFNEA